MDTWSWPLKGVSGHHTLVKGQNIPLSDMSLPSLELAGCLNKLTLKKYITFDFTWEIIFSIVLFIISSHTFILVNNYTHIVSDRSYLIFI